MSALRPTELLIEWTRPVTPKLQLRFDNLKRLVAENPPLHNVNCLFPDVCKVMGEDFYVTKSDGGISVRDRAPGGARVAMLVPG